MRENAKMITLRTPEGERRFRLRKMDAMTGACLLKFIVEKVSPVLTPLTEGAEDSAIPAAVEKALPMVLQELSDEDLRRVMLRCLRHVDMELPAGFHPVHLRDRFGIPELEEDTVTCLRLTYHEILWCLAGFFAASGLLTREEA
ncbi:MAG: hypothetical protein Q4G19_02730 [Clostridia bacterium]|nr:hypothetical protein [Clostridia bacterium]